MNQPIHHEVCRNKGEDRAEEELGHVRDDRKGRKEEEELRGDDEGATYAGARAGAEGEERLREDIRAGESACSTRNASAQ